MSSVLSLVQDVTKLNKTEQALRESRESYKELVTNARSMILKFDNNANFTFINDYALEFFGYNLEELLGKSVKIVVPAVESTGRDLDEMVEKITEDPDSYSVNINENIKKNGEKVWVEWHNKALYDKSGNKTSHIAIGIDITKRRLAEENLKESERKLKSVLNATLESIYMFDTKGKICMANTTGIVRLKRNSESEVIGHHFSEFMTPEITISRQKMHQEVICTAKPLEFDDERDHRTYHHNFSPVLIDDKVQFVVTYSTDITESKNSELKLKQSEDRLRSIAESLTVMISITRVDDSLVLFANEPYLKTFGFKLNDIIGKKEPDIFVNPEDRISIQDSLKESEYVDNREIKVKRSDGSSLWIITSIRIISYMGEMAFLASSIDITGTKKTQEELVRLNRTLNAHSKSSQAMMHSKDEISYLNEVCKIIIKDCGHSMVWVGYAQNDEEKNVLPVSYYGFDRSYIDEMKITWDDSVYGRGPTGTAIRTGRPSICRNMLTDPRFAPWREAAVSRGFASSLVLPLISEGRTFGAVSIYSKEPDSFSDSEIDLLNDLADDLAHGISYIRLEESERAAARAIKESESKLKELIITKDKFFNIVAHDLKNPFTSLLGSSELLYDNISQMTTDNVKKLALILNDSAKSGYAILQNLLDWSRSQTGMIRFCPHEINLRLIINENIDNLNLQTSNKEITMLSGLTTDLIIIADINLINTVLRNLLSNAVKFTHKKGVVKVNAVSLMNEVILSVTDSGIGMPQDKIDQLFKLENSLSMPGTEKEQGTGLGLKLCKEFTELMGGRIWVESEPGKGSKFCFTIPVDRGNELRDLGT
jgi:PAS domain S-box-containing protein